MTILGIVPTQREFEAFVSAVAGRGHEAFERAVGRVTVLAYNGGTMLVARGGLGKAQMAIHTQHLIEHVKDLRLVVCAGTAGSLSDGLAIGDVVVGTATIEHDFKWGDPDRAQPRFEGHAESIAALTAAPGLGPFRIEFGPIASGDEAIVGSGRAAQVRESTGALAVAFEGAGAARACEFSGVPFLELRSISDSADERAIDEFYKNLPLAMANVSIVFEELAQSQARARPQERL